MMDWNTYFTTQNTSGGPIIKQLDPAVSNESVDDDDGGSAPTLGVQIGQVINVVLLLGLLLYFCLAR